MSTFGSVSTQQLYGPSMRRNGKLPAGLHPPIGASPGEMRLWLKMNGLLGDDKKRVGQVGRRVNVGKKLPPIGERKPLVATTNIPPTTRAVKPNIVEEQMAEPVVAQAARAASTGGAPVSRAEPVAQVAPVAQAQPIAQADPAAEAVPTIEAELAVEAVPTASAEPDASVEAEAEAEQKCVELEAEAAPIQAPAEEAAAKVDDEAADYGDDYEADDFEPEPVT